MDIQINDTDRINLQKVEVKEEEIDFEVSDLDVWKELKSEIKKEEIDIMVYTGIVIDEDHGNNLIPPGINYIKNDDTECENQYTKQEDIILKKSLQNENALKSVNHVKDNLRVHPIAKPQQCSKFAQRISETDNGVSQNNLHTGVRTYKCCFCDEVFAKENGLREHLWIHYSKCKICSKTFAQKTALALHMKIHHNGDYYQEHKKNPLRECDESNAANPVRQTISQEVEKAYKCHFCKEVFAKEKGLKQHLQIHFSKCKICSMTFAQKSALALHMKTHHYVDYYQEHKKNPLRECDESNAVNPVRHTISREVEKAFKCHFCPMTYFGSRSFISHLRANHNDKSRLILPKASKADAGLPLDGSAVKQSNIILPKTSEPVAGLSFDVSVGSEAEALPVTIAETNEPSSVPVQDNLVNMEPYESSSLQTLTDGLNTQSVLDQPAGPNTQQMIQLPQGQNLQGMIQLTQGSSILETMQLTPAQNMQQIFQLTQGQNTQQILMLPHGSGTQGSVQFIQGPNGQPILQYSQVSNAHETLQIAQETNAPPALQASQKECVPQGEKPYQINKLDEYNSHESNLNKHSISQNEEKQIHCPLCSKKYMLASTLRIHIREEHILKMHFRDDHKLGLKPSKKMFKATINCPICWKKFKFEKRFLTHFKKHNMHGSNPIKQTISHNEEGKIQCHLCSKTYMLASTLVIHLREEHRIGLKEKRYCTFCSKQFKTVNGFIVHLRQEHNIPRRTAIQILSKLPRIGTEEPLGNSTSLGTGGNEEPKEPSSSEFLSNTQVMQLTQGQNSQVTLQLEQGSSILETLQQTPEPKTQQILLLPQGSGTKKSGQFTQGSNTHESLQTTQATNAPPASQVSQKKCVSQGEKPNESNSNGSNLNKHTISQNEEKFQCNLCSERYMLASSLRIHLREKHKLVLNPSKTALKTTKFCHFCSKKFNCIEQFIPHLYMMHNLPRTQLRQIISKPPGTGTENPLGNSAGSEAEENQSTNTEANDPLLQIHDNLVEEVPNKSSLNTNLASDLSGELNKQQILHPPKGQNIQITQGPTTQQIAQFPQPSNSQATLQQIQQSNTQYISQFPQGQSTQGQMSFPQVSFTQPTLQFSHGQLLPHTMNSQPTFMLSQGPILPQGLNVQQSYQLSQGQQFLFQGQSSNTTSQLLLSQGINTQPTIQHPQEQLFVYQGTNAHPTLPIPQNQFVLQSVSQVPQGQPLSQGMNAQPIPQENMFSQVINTQPIMQVPQGQILSQSFDGQSISQLPQGLLLSQGINGQSVSQVSQEQAMHQEIKLES